MTVKRLTQISDISGAARTPAYDPAAHGCGIVHLGLGAFHRAHQAAMTDAALASEGGDWRITGVSLRSRSVVDALEAQNCLYTLLERDAQGVRGRVIGAIGKAIAADPRATLDALCEPATRIVTLTVTEKGYGINRETGGPDLSTPVIAHDLAHLDAPSGVLGLLAVALSARRNAGLSPFTVLCCDNLPDNGQFLKNGVTGFARHMDVGLADWIVANVAFPSSMVDRITPAASDTTRADAHALTGCSDLCAIETEPFCQWVIEDNFPQGRPAWEAGGALFVDDVAKFEHMKLRVLNGAHSMLAYTGFLSGKQYVREVMADANLAKLVRRHLRAAAKTLEPLSMIDYDIYARELEARFSNPAIAHETYQIAMDGTQKLPQRIFAPALDAIASGQDIRPFAFATAMWMRYCLGVDDTGAPYEIRDPYEAEIKAALDAQPRDGFQISKALQMRLDLFPTKLKENTDWQKLVAEILDETIEKGVRSVVTSEA